MNEGESTTTCGGRCHTGRPSGRGAESNDYVHIECESGTVGLEINVLFRFRTVGICTFYQMLGPQYFYYIFDVTR